MHAKDVPHLDLSYRNILIKPSLISETVANNMMPSPGGIKATILLANFAQSSGFRKKNLLTQFTSSVSFPHQIILQFL